MVSGSTGGRGNGASEAQLSQVQAGDEGIDNADDSVGSDVINAGR
jgi:hypothetical protein